MTEPAIVRTVVLLLWAITSTSCSPAQSQSVLTVEQVIPRIEELNGQTVSVAGYLSYCDTYHCPLFRNKEDADEWGRFIEVAQATGRRPPSVPDDPMLGIGSGTNMDFDAKAAPFWNSYVVITGTITDERRVDGEPVCSDRAPDLEPRDIRAGRAPAPR